MKKHWNYHLYCLGLAVALLGAFGAHSVAEDAEQLSYLSFARFKIPFNIESDRQNVEEVQLWVSTDQGKSWQMHGSALPGAKHFEFQAAAEGLYFFSVQTLDKSGNVYPSQSPYLKVYVDTSKPQTALKADVNSEGKLVIKLRAADDNLLPNSAVLRVRTDRDPNWQEAHLESLVENNGIFESKAVLEVPTCREVAFVFTVTDVAGNQAEATALYTMPRTATGKRDLTLASSTKQTQTQVPSLQNAVPWNEDSVTSPQTTTNGGIGNLASNSSPRPTGELSLESSEPNERARPEELPLPSSLAPQTSDPASAHYDSPPALETQPPTSTSDAAQSTKRDFEEPSNAYHCNSRAFSLDYSVEALGGTTLSDVELWGTEDGGRTWQKWGGDPDRQSPFDVQVGNDGLFGFRMVIVASNGLVSNRPKEGDSADMWINVDTSEPTAKIKRALYGQGAEEGMLVIDYTCNDGHLVERPITLSYSESADGPWTKIVGGLPNTGIYLWKSTPNLPAKVFVQLEVLDKAGNVGKHRLDAPISTKELGPRGRIQGFRPIAKPQEE